MQVNASAEAFAPATMGNVGVGFDILGLAFKKPGDTVRVVPRDEPGAVMLSIEGDGGALPLDASKNTAAVAANALLSQIGASCGVGITLCKDLPLASGLGSSAASAVAAVVAVNALFGEPLPRRELLAACLEGEAVVSGHHADNVAPALLGGIVLVTGLTGDALLSLPVPSDLHLSLVTPEVAVPTAEARAVLPKTIAMKTLIDQTAGVARLVDSLHRGDVAALAAAMEADAIVEPARKHLIPHLDTVRAEAKAAGALAVVISGAGPTLCAVCSSESVAEQVATVMQNTYQRAEIHAISRYTQVNEQGAEVREVIA